METRKASANEYQKLLILKEDRFNDVKSKRIKPQKLQETFVAFANSDGGDLYIGVEDEKIQGERVLGFDDFEDANGIINTFLTSVAAAG
jgi:ATP-dependent DNA helicase RecG